MKMDNKELIAWLRLYLGLTEQDCSDDELLRATKRGTLGAEIIEFHVSLCALIAEMKERIKGKKMCVK